MRKLPVIVAGIGATVLILIGWSRLSKASPIAGPGHADPIYVPEEDCSDKDPVTGQCRTVLVDQWGNQTLQCFESEHGRESEIPCLREAPSGSWVTWSPEQQAAALAEQDAEVEAAASRWAAAFAQGTVPYAKTAEERAADIAADAEERAAGLNSGVWDTVKFWITRDGVPDMAARRQRLSDAGVLRTVYLSTPAVDAGMAAWSRIIPFFQQQAVKDWLSVSRTQQNSLYQSRWELFMSVWAQPPVTFSVAPGFVQLVKVTF